MAASVASTPAALPAYSNDPEPPSYLVEPARHEQRVAFAPLSGGRALRAAIDASETYVRRTRTGGITLALKGQSSNPRIQPTYGRRGLIEGELSLADPDNIIAVKIKLEGTLEVSRDGLADPTCVMSVVHPVWTRSEAENLCPTLLPISVRLPTTFRELDRTYQIPPTIFAYFPGKVTIAARVLYVMLVVVTRKRKLMMKDWVSDSTLTVYWSYGPRARPPQPLIRAPLTVRSTLKPSPGEWAQIYSVMPVREDSSLTPIDCHLVIPAVKTFAFTDTIPFHVQLSGPRASLRELYPPTLSKAKAAVHRERIVRVYLYRELLMTIRNQELLRSQLIGEGTLTAIPPPLDEVEGEEEEDDGSVQRLDWEGEIRCDGQVEQGGFRTGKLTVKDFIVISVRPPNAQTSPLKPHRYAHTVSLVTDTFDSADEIGGHRR